MSDINTVMESIAGRIKHIEDSLEADDTEGLLAELLSLTGYLAGTMGISDKAGDFVTKLAKQVIENDWDDEEEEEMPEFLN